MSVIATATNTVVGLIPVGNVPLGVAVTRTGAKSMSRMVVTAPCR